MCTRLRGLPATIIADEVAPNGDETLLLSGGYDKLVRLWVRKGEGLGTGGGMATMGGGGVATMGGGGMGGGGMGGGGMGGGAWALEHTLSGHTDGVLSLELSL